MQKACPNTITLQSRAFGREHSHEAWWCPISFPLELFACFLKAEAPNTALPVRLSGKACSRSPREQRCGRAVREWGPARACPAPAHSPEPACLMLHTYNQGEGAEPPSIGFLRNRLQNLLSTSSSTLMPYSGSPPGLGNGFSFFSFFGENSFS